jgi:hypothetical protein
MAYSFRDDFPESPNLRSKGPALPKDKPSRLPEIPKLFPSPDPNNPFGDVPRLQPPQEPFRIWKERPIPAAPYIPPMWWPVPALPSPGTDPFPDPSKMRLPPIPQPQEPPPYDLDPSNFPGQGGTEPVGGLLSMLLRGMIREGQVQSGTDSTSYGAPEYRSERYNSQLSGLLDRLGALHDVQSGSADAPQKPVRILSRRVAG